MYRFTFQPYHRPFRQPLPTHHGLWSNRDGIVVRLENEAGQVGWGEVAPLPWFGSETIEQALNYCCQLPQQVSSEKLLAIPPTLPACQFGFGTALEGFHARDSSPTTDTTTFAYCGLLPTGPAALGAWPDLWQQGYRTFKWKIAVAPISAELEWMQQLVAQLPTSAQLRLDANGGLSLDAVQRWLEACDRHPHTIEYLEQPLPPDRLETMITLTLRHTTPLALDESVATLAQLKSCYQHGWRGIFVVKPAIAGYPQHLRLFCQTHPIDAVFSSVFETEIGRQACLQLAQELSAQHRAVGFGVNHWFASGLGCKGSTDGV